MSVKIRLTGLLIVLPLLLLAVASAWLWPRYPYLPAEPLPFRVERVSQNPIIHVGLSERLTELSQREGLVNINGPSLIRVPGWVQKPLGKYYLYFAHHKGDFIRMAYADNVAGPWTVYEPGVLRLQDSLFPTTLGAPQKPADAIKSLWEQYSIYVARDLLLLNHRSTVTDQALREQRGITRAANRQPHIASPDVVVDEDNQRLLLYYHGLDQSGGQYSRVARSTDGVNFTPVKRLLRGNYLRVFRYRGAYYALGMPGIVYRSKNADDGFEPRDRLLFEPDMRHAGLWLRGATLYVFWSRAGDAPERILVSQLNLSPPDWNDWRATQAQSLLAPELPWEGSHLQVESSLRGELGLPANELRDPAVFTDTDGQTYMLYVAGGERAIGLARLVERSSN